MEKGGRKIIPLPGGRSEVWKRKLFGFYSNDGKTILDRQRAVCCVCFNEIPYSGNTTNLGLHLAKRHSEIYLTMKAELEVMGKNGAKLPGPRNTIGSTVVPNTQSSQPVLPKTAIRSVHITDAVASFLAKDLLSLCIAKGEGFRHLLEVLEPRIDLLEAQALLDVLQAKKQAITNNLLEKLNDIEACALTTDCWSADSGRTYCTLMVRFIDAKWEVQNFVLKTMELTADQMHNHIWDIHHVLADWALMPRIIYQAQIETQSGVESGEEGTIENPVILVESNLTMKVFAAVTNDNGCEAPDLKNLGMTRVPCFANVVNTAVEAGIDAVNAPTVSELIGKSRRLVTHFLRTSKDRLTLNKINEDLKNESRELVIDVCNRWTTTSEMLGHLLDSKNAINSVLMSHKERAVRELGLSPEEWYQIEELHGAMKAISMAIGILGGDENAYCSMVAPLLHRLKEKFMKISEHDTPSVFQFKKVVWDHLNPHYNDADIQTLLNTATFLDPRFKDMIHLAQQQRDEVIQSIRQTIMVNDEAENGILGLSQQEEHADAPPAKRRQRLQELDLLFGNIEDKGPDSGVDAPGGDLDKYMQEAPIGIKESPLDWWKRNSHRYPTVAKVARRQLCVPAIAVPSECLLPQDGSVFFNRRKRLTAEEVDDMVFLNKNFHLLN